MGSQKEVYIDSSLYTHMTACCLNTARSLKWHQVITKCTVIAGVISWSAAQGRRVSATFPACWFCWSWWRWCRWVSWCHTGCNRLMVSVTTRHRSPPPPALPHPVNMDTITPGTRGASNSQSQISVLTRGTNQKRALWPVVSRPVSNYRREARHLGWLGLPVPGRTRGVIYDRGILLNVTWAPPGWSHKCQPHKQSWTATTRFCQAPWPRISSHRKPRKL